MGLKLTVLASGSGGNATLVEAGEFGLLLDVGLGPRQLGARLADAGASWDRVHAVLLTHTHSDHWDDATLTQLWRRRTPLYCSGRHHQVLQNWSRGFTLLKTTNLVRDCEAGMELQLAPGLRCLPVPLRHDSGVTFGFRFEGAPDLFGEGSAIAYAADLGSWDASLAASLADVDLLALEFNHDVALECASRRSPALIARVISDEGHLSNDQAGELLREILRRSPPGRLAHLVQLHLSRECNRPLLAQQAARAALGERAGEVQLHTTEQDRITPPILLGGAADSRRPRRRPVLRRGSTRPGEQNWLPGLEQNVPKEPPAESD
jgi:phosphoribosyl 1,2-cyclic phosphodiesterase